MVQVRPLAPEFLHAEDMAKKKKKEWNKENEKVKVQEEVVQE